MDFWPQHKDFVLRVLAGFGVFLVALIARGITPDVLTDQTSAHDPVGGYVPDGMSFEQAFDAIADKFEAEGRGRRRDPRSWCCCCSRAISS